MMIGKGKRISPRRFPRFRTPDGRFLKDYSGPSGARRGRCLFPNLFPDAKRGRPMRLCHCRWRQT
jgi:hypothetical protein